MDINTTMENTKKKNGHGGSRPGAGRKPGSRVRITCKEILDTANSVLGKPFIVSLMEGYMHAIATGNTRDRIQYEKVILDKTASSAIEAEITSPADSIEAKQLAFSAALQNLIKQSETVVTK